MNAEAPDKVQDEDAHDSKEQSLLKYFLQEWKFIKSTVDNIVINGGVTDLSTVSKIRSLMDKYQEQGQLIEPYLEAIVSPLMRIVRAKTVELGAESDIVFETIKPLCIIIYSLVTVCGHKAVTKFFPHQVSDLEVAVSLMEKCHGATGKTSLRQESTGEMEMKCVILFWLSILVLIPFDISSVDTHICTSSTYAGSVEPSPLVLKLVSFSTDYLSNAGPMRHIAALLISRLLTRPDMLPAFHRFTEWTHEILSSETDVENHFQLLGSIEALAALFKIGSQKILLDIVPCTWSDVSIMVKSTIVSQSSLVRKFLMKLTQCMGLACLPRCSTAWKYMERRKAFDEAISDIGNGICSSKFIEDEDMNVPEIIEGIIDMLLSGLRDSDTVVRWTAAKGIGRVAACLTLSYADDVLSSVLDLFSPREVDGSWHGGCLALAELTRRGVLMPRSLTRVVPVIIQALHYDIRRGSHSVGHHVRDAAAYVCWAFGRAYSHFEMKGIFEQLAPHLLTVACYDREVNCRRAAAAAVQENVGRQGSFPHGIDIINTADYFSLASRVNSYLVVAVSISQYPEYFYPFVEDLLCSKICHWDKGLRDLAARALSALTKYNFEYFADVVLEKLISCTLSSDLCMRHGATLAAAEIILTLHQSGYVLSAETQISASKIIPAIEKARLYRGKGGEIMRSCVSRLIECTAVARICLPFKIKRCLLGILDENLRHPNSQIQVSAVEALRHFVPQYLCETSVADDIVSKYLKHLDDPNVAVKRGSALAIGVLPLKFLKERWIDILTRLCQSCLIHDNPEECDVEVRVNAVHGLLAACETLSGERQCHLVIDSDQDISLYLFIKNNVIDTLLKALDDYTVDNRGDIGSLVREAAMIGLEKCIYILCGSGLKPHGTPLLFDQHLAINVIGGFLKQAMEKIDRIRDMAGKILQRVLYHPKFSIPSICHREELEGFIPNDAYFEWGAPCLSFPRLVNTLQFSCYSRNVLTGLVVSIGGLQESLRKSSFGALLDYLHVAQDKELRKTREYKLCADLLWVLEHYGKCDRVIVPTLKTIELLLGSGFFLAKEGQIQEFAVGVLVSLVSEMNASRNFSKLLTGISILGYLSSAQQPFTSEAFSRLLCLLGHRYPKIRKASADQVYLILLQWENVVEAGRIDRALEIISETCWDNDIKEAESSMLKLYEMAALEIGNLSKVHSNDPIKKGGRRATSDENESYSALVGSTGF